MEVSDMTKIYGIALTLYYIGFTYYLAKDRTGTLLLNAGHESEAIQTAQEVVSVDEGESFDSIVSDQEEEHETEIDVTEVAEYDQVHDSDLENMVEMEGEAIAEQSPPMDSLSDLQGDEDAIEQNEETEIANEIEEMPDDGMDQDEDEDLDDDEILNADQ